MDSPDHRQNILNEGYDSVGISAEESAQGVLFVTEDFSTRLVVLSHDQATRQAASVAQSIRRKRGVGALFWDDKADLLAQETAESKAAVRGLGDIPASFGEVHALWVESALIQDLGKYADEIGLARYQKAGLGVTFRRTRENPGGEYIIVLVLLPGDRRPDGLRPRK